MTLSKHVKAGLLLESMRESKEKLEAVQAAAEQDLEAVRVKYQDEIRRLDELFRAQEKALINLMKRNTSTFFADTDHVILDAGQLFYDKTFKVSIPRHALEKAEQLGLTDAIKISKSLDRAVVEQWPIERLMLIDASRKLKESFSYELKREKRDGTQQGQ